VFRFAIALGLLRVLFLCGLAFRQYRSRRSEPGPAGTGSEQLASVLIPAYNEGKVITLAVQRVLGSDYRNIEVIVIDDGSTDDTSSVVASRYGDHPRVRLLTLVNGGKARAVNAGLRIARGAIIVALDADTQFEPDCIRKLVRWFDDPAIGAVAGNAKVGNRMNVITLWQALEYVTAQNLERRALATLDCITVVPGAVGAWRRTALDQLGGFPADTLAEDQDLTLAVLKAGHRIVYDDTALAWTEAPQSVAGLARQRFRWAFGTLQCLWKHRDALFRPRFGTLGMIALPQAWLFQILFGLISPLVDLALVWQIGVTVLDLLQHHQQTDSTNLMITAGYYALFTMADLLAGVVAFAMERKEQWRLLAWLIPQRFGYRQIMYYVVVKSVLTAIRGPAVGWGKLDRTANVKSEA
jgi:peptidoglycan-N-acetylglucosamine deacetylase